MTHPIGDRPRPIFRGSLVLVVFALLVMHGFEEWRWLHYKARQYVDHFPIDAYKMGALRWKPGDDLRFDQIYATTRDGREAKLSSRQFTYPFFPVPLSKRIQDLAGGQATAAELDTVMAQLFANIRRNQGPHASEADIVAIRVLVEVKHIGPPYDERLYTPDTLITYARYPPLLSEKTGP